MKNDVRTKFMVQNKEVSVLDVDENLLSEKLEPAIYSVKYHQLRGYYLYRTADAFSVPKRLYGSIEKRAKKVMTAYDQRSTNTGVLLTGDKGSGKTELCKVISNMAIVNNMPVIICNEPYSGDEFNSFINKLGDICLFFDEFAKQFDKLGDHNSPSDPQDDLLTLLEGTASQKRLVLLTENESWKVNSCIKSRPGRIYYHFQYKKVEEEVIVEYCNELGITKEITNEIKYMHNTSDEFSFDSLKAVVEEHLRFPSESLQDIIKDLNIETTEDKFIFTITKTDLVDGRKPLEMEYPNFKFDGYLRIAITKPKNGSELRNTPTTIGDFELSPVDEDSDQEFIGFHPSESLVFQSGENVIFETDRGTIEGTIKKVQPRFYGAAF